MNYSATNLRNVGIIGHSGSGKTSLTEAILYFTSMVDRLGTIEEGNTVSDYDTEEKNVKYLYLPQYNRVNGKTQKLI